MVNVDDIHPHTRQRAMLVNIISADFLLIWGVKHSTDLVPLHILLPVQELLKYHHAFWYVFMSFYLAVWTQKSPKQHTFRLGRGDKMCPRHQSPRIMISNGNKWQYLNELGFKTRLTTGLHHTNPCHKHIEALIKHGCCYADKIFRCIFLN